MICESGVYRSAEQVVGGGETNSVIDQEVGKVNGQVGCNGGFDIVSMLASNLGRNVIDQIRYDIGHHGFDRIGDDMLRQTVSPDLFGDDTATVQGNPLAISGAKGNVGILVGELQVLDALERAHVDQTVYSELGDGPEGKFLLDRGTRCSFGIGGEGSFFHTDDAVDEDMLKTGTVHKVDESAVLLNVKGSSLLKNMRVLENKRIEKI